MELGSLGANTGLSYNNHSDYIDNIKQIFDTFDYIHFFTYWCSAVLLRRKDQSLCAQENPPLLQTSHGDT